MSFYNNYDAISSEFSDVAWLDETGLRHDDLIKQVELIETSYKSRSIIKAKIFELLADKSRIAIDKYNIFQDKLYCGAIIQSERLKWQKEALCEFMPEEAQAAEEAWEVIGSHFALGDYGHTSPNTQILMDIGFVGVLDRIEAFSKSPALSQKQKDFYESCRIVISSMISLANRFAVAIKPYNEKNATALEHIASTAPSNVYEAMQLLLMYFFLHEFVYGTRTRTLGRLDVLLYPFYKKDIENGIFTKDEVREMLRFFLYKFWCAKIPFDLPFCLAGIDQNGDEVTNELSYLIVDVYDELNIHSPKIHIRVSDKTPADFLLRVLSAIRKGNSSFVFINDKTAIESLVRVGVEEIDARNYVPIGCYEPAVWGVEMGCTGNSGVSLPKAIEFVINDGADLKTGKLCSLKPGKINSFDDFVFEVKRQLTHITSIAMDYVCKIEKLYDRINPDSIQSALYERSLETGVDVYEGGAKYNNSSVYFISIATLIDSLCAVKKLVFDDRLVTYDELKAVLKNDWRNNEDLLARAKGLSEKYGASNPFADELTKDISVFLAALVNNKKNSRGGVFKAGLFSIDQGFILGEKTMATPDGRRAGEPFSKNLCATVGMDIKGVTSLINSVTHIDMADFSDGSVLDVVLHPSSVQGDDGLVAFMSLVKTFFKKGGLAFQGNVFDSDDLKEAQINPEKYKNLQVRVCGWNAYFVDLSKAEQDAFIKQAESFN